MCCGVESVAVGGSGWTETFWSARRLDEHKKSTDTACCKKLLGLEAASAKKYSSSTYDESYVEEDSAKNT